MQQPRTGGDLNLKETDPGCRNSSKSHFPGEYGFTVRLMDNKNLYSEHFNRLYIKRKTLCPFGICTLASPPNNSQLKIYVYSEDMNPVMRCRSHSENEKNEYFFAPLHFMRSESNNAMYDCCPDTGHLSISIPYQHDCFENVETLTFLCSSKSCIKKDLFLKFSLLNRNEVIGYQTFGLHVCSSPSRDKLNHEGGKVRNEMKRKLYSEGETDDHDHKMFKLAIGRKWIRNLVVEVDRGLELLEATTVEEQEYFLKRHRAKRAKRSRSASYSSSVSTSKTGCSKGSIN